MGLFDAAFAIALLALLVLSVVLLFARFDWRIDAARSFVPFYFAAAIPCLIYFAARRKRFWIALSVMVTAHHAWAVLPYYVSIPHANAAGSTLRVMTANFQWDNSNPRLFFDAVREVNPDILALQEVTPEHLRRLEQLHSEYPYHTEHVKESVLGVALLSRYPLTNTQRFWLTKGVYATLMADVELNGEKTTIMVAHTVPPFNADWTARRDKQLAEMPAKLESGQPSRVILGDLNITMWSPAFKRLVRTAGLRNARQGFGILPTFSGKRPIIPIDHCLYRGNLHVVNCRRGPFTGSDHLPLIVDIAHAGPKVY